MLTREDIIRRIENLKIGITAAQNRLMTLREELHYKEAEYKRFVEEIERYTKMLENYGK